MSNAQTGGPAFPSGLESGHMDPLHHGMTLRDYFAAKAMCALIDGLISKGEAVTSDDRPLVAITAYRMADAMLGARGNP